MSEERIARGKIGPIVSIVILTVLIVVFLGTISYFDYSHDSAMEQACVAEYGDGADWVGNGFEGNVVCELPNGELRYADEPSQWNHDVAGFANELGEAVGIR